MTPAPGGDKEKILRSWREYIAFFFDLNVDTGDLKMETLSSEDNTSESTTTSPLSPTKLTDKVMILTGTQNQTFLFVCR